MSMHVIFVAPFLFETTLRFVAGEAHLPGVNLSLISQDDADKIPHGIRSELATFWRVNDALDADQLVQAARGLEEKLGPPGAQITSLVRVELA